MRVWLFCDVTTNLVSKIKDFLLKLLTKLLARPQHTRAQNSSQIKYGDLQLALKISIRHLTFKWWINPLGDNGYYSSCNHIFPHAHSKFAVSDIIGWLCQSFQVLLDTQRVSQQKAKRWAIWTSKEISIQWLLLQHFQLQIGSSHRQQASENSSFTLLHVSLH